MEVGGSVKVLTHVKKENFNLLPQLQEPEFFPECWKTLLKGVVAYVDCRTDSDNRSKSIASELERLGATCVTHFSKKVTHLIFKDGSKPIYDKAKKMGIPIISYLWVVACKEKGEKVPVDGYPALSSQDYDSPFFKWRKMKSMQPKDLDEELKLAEKRLERKRKKVQKDTDSGKTKENAEKLVLCSPVIERKSIIDSLIESSPLVQERIHQELAAGKTYDEVFSLKKEEEDDFDTFFDTPLMIKFIAKNYYSPKDPPPLSVRKILSDIRTPKSQSDVISNRIGERSVESLPNTSGNQENASPLSAMLQTGNKRKKENSDISSLSKKLKGIEQENEENTIAGIKDKMPRKNLFRQKCQSLIPEELTEAKTPQDSPIKSTQHHPCFSQPQIAPKIGERINHVAQVPVSPELLVPRTQPRRDSMADFRSHVLRKCHNERKELRRRNSSMVVVCTSLHSDELSTVAKAVEDLGQGSKITELVDDSTTHVVCGDSRRTLNVMRGVIRGVKLVTYQWVLDSMNKGRWLDEEDYSVERFAKRATVYRESRKSRRIFDKFPAIYVSAKSVIPHRDLCDLITCAGGRLTSTCTKASVIVGQLKSKVHDAPCVNGTWILDCIEQGCSLPLTDFLISS